MFFPRSKPHCKMRARFLADEPQPHRAAAAANKTELDFLFSQRTAFPFQHQHTPSRSRSRNARSPFGEVFEPGRGITPPELHPPHSGPPVAAMQRHSPDNLRDKRILEIPMSQNHSPRIRRLTNHPVKPGQKQREKFGRIFHDTPPTFTGLKSRVFAPSPGTYFVPAFAARSSKNLRAYRKAAGRWE